MKELTKESVAQTLSYDPLTGLFTRVGVFEGNLRQTRPDTIGLDTGCVSGKGYFYINLGPRKYLAHRLAFLLMTGAMPRYIDHKDGNPSNNKWDNLRACTQSQNLANQGVSKRSTSGFKGVTWCSATGKWRAKIAVNGKHIHLGRFEMASAAGAAYTEACKFYFGEFGRSV